jgi:hypothetical protein
VSDAFVAARVADAGRVFGALPAGVDPRPLLDRARPE